MYVLTLQCLLSCQSATGGEIKHFGVSLKDGSRCNKPDGQRSACLKGECMVILSTNKLEDLLNFLNTLGRWLRWHYWIN